LRCVRGKKKNLRRENQPSKKARLALVKRGSLSWGKKEHHKFIIWGEKKKGKIARLKKEKLWGRI